MNGNEMMLSRETQDLKWRFLAAKSEDELVGNPFSEIVQEDGLQSILDRVYRTGVAEAYTEPETSAIQTSILVLRDVAAPGCR